MILGETVEHLTKAWRAGRPTSSEKKYLKKNRAQLVSSRQTTNRKAGKQIDKQKIQNRHFVGLALNIIGKGGNLQELGAGLGQKLAQSFLHGPKLNGTRGNRGRLLVRAFLIHSVITGLYEL